MSAPRTISRRPQVGDVVLSDQGNLYVVVEVMRDGMARRVHCYAVVDLATGRYPNSMDPGEVAVVAAADAARLRATAE